MYAGYLAIAAGALVVIVAAWEVYRLLQKKKEKQLSPLARELERLKTLLLRSDAVFVEGVDFLGLNYGDEYAKVFGEAPSKLAGNTGSAYIDRQTQKWKFLDYWTRNSEASHVKASGEMVKFDLTFAQVRQAFEKK